MPRMNDAQIAAAFDRLSAKFDHHQTRFERLCRRVQCVGKSPEREKRIERLEDLAGHELDGMIAVAEAICELPSQRSDHIRAKALITRSLMCEEEPASLAERLTRSLCRDLLASAGGAPVEHRSLSSATV